VRSAASRTTVTREDALTSSNANSGNLKSRWTGNFGPEVPLHFNHWGQAGHAFPYITDRCAPNVYSSPAGNVEAYEAHYNSSFQTHCNNASLPSPVHEYNDACCGYEHAHNADHYDSKTQVCCNPDKGYPSSRVRSSSEMGFPYTATDVKEGLQC
jgi:hypothetical protein